MHPVVARFILRLRSWIVRLADSIMPPELIVLDNAFGMARTRLLDVAARYDIASALEKEGPRTARELAASLKLHPDSLHRVLRALAVMGIFELDSKGRFRNNRASRVLIPGKPRSLHAFVRYFASGSNSRAWENVASTVESGKNAFEAHHGLRIWDWLEKHPEEERQFGAAMRGLTEMDAPLVAAAYDFSRFKVVCDVAGGSGVLVSEILARHPGVEAMVYDSAKSFGASPQARVRRVTGNLFESVPEGADAYLLKDILHDWDDMRSLQILRNCRKAMPQGGGKLLIVEMLVEPNHREAPGVVADVQMMTVCCEGRQRSRAEMEYLLRNAGFQLERIVPLASPYSIVEARGT